MARNTLGIVRAARQRTRSTVVEALETRALFSSVSGFVYADVDGNAAYNLGDIPLVGRTVWVDLDNDSVLDAGEPSGVTNSVAGIDPPGTYRIDNVANSSFALTLRLLPENSSWLQTYPQGNTPYLLPLPPSAGNVDLTGRDFGTRNTLTNGWTSQINGYVVGDRNGDGLRGSGEFGQGGLTLWVDLDDDGTIDSTEPTTVTDSLGKYTFNVYNPYALSTLNPKYTYRVRLVVPSQYSQTAPASVYKDYAMQAMTGLFGQDDFAVVPPGILQGTTFHDLDGNRSRGSGEPVLSGRTVYADLNTNGSLDTGEPSAVSDSTGAFKLEVAAGTYQIRQVVPSGWAATTTEPQSFTFSSGFTTFGASFGSVDEIGEISGTVFNDVNANGIRDGGESGFPFQQVFLDTNDNDILDSGEPTATASIAGAYSFKRLPAGNYVVKMAGPVTSPGSATYMVTLASDQVVTGRDFGRNTTTAGYLRGRVFNDADGDGVREAGDTPRAGQTLRIYRAATISSPEELFATTISDAGGHYGFGGLPADAFYYRVEAEAVAGQLFNGKGTQSAGFSAGLGFADMDIGAYAGSIARGRINDDRDASGGNSSGDNLLSGWTVYVDANGNDMLDSGERSSVSDIVGNWSLGAPASGQQTFRVAPPSGWRPTNPVSGEFTINVSATPRFYESQNFYFTSLAAASGRLFNDKNGNGAFDTGDAVYSGFRVYDDANQSGTFDGNETWIASGSDGVWKFPALALGAHHFRVDGSPTNVSLITPATGVYDRTFTAGEAPANLDFVYSAVVTPPPPQVTKVFISSTVWTSNFNDFLQSSGAGESAFGIAVDPANQLDEVPWTNLNRFSVRFSRNVTAAQANLVVTGTNLANYGISAFAYDATTFTATWTLSTTGIANDKVALNLSGVTDAATGAALDGEWPGLVTNAFPSGNGTAGGVFRFRINVLPGDVNRSGGSVTGSDVTLVRNAQNSTPGAPNSLYTIFKDVNGSGSILGSDVTSVRNRQGISLPTDEPPTPTFIRLAATVKKRTTTLLSDVLISSSIKRK